LTSFPRGSIRHGNPGFPPQGGLGVTFFDGPNLLDTVPVNASGQASLTTTFTAEGAYEITAAYNGNGNCGASNVATTAQVTSEPPRPVQQANAYRFP
jgi:hypothetical protein